jgi:hypothetical protein
LFLSHKKTKIEMLSVHEEERSVHDPEEDCDDDEQVVEVILFTPNEKQNRIRRSEDNRSKHEARDADVTKFKMSKTRVQCKPRDDELAAWKTQAEMCINTETNLSDCGLALNVLTVRKNTQWIETFSLFCLFVKCMDLTPSQTLNRTSNPDLEAVGGLDKVDWIVPKVCQMPPQLMAFIDTVHVIISRD